MTLVGEAARDASDPRELTPNPGSVSVATGAAVALAISATTMAGVADVDSPPAVPAPSAPPVASGVEAGDVVAVGDGVGVGEQTGMESGVGFQGKPGVGAAPRIAGASTTRTRVGFPNTLTSSLSTHPIVSGETWICHQSAKPARPNINRFSSMSSVPTTA